MRLWILSRIAALLGIQFKVNGLPYGARTRPNADAGVPVGDQIKPLAHSEQDQSCLADGGKCGVGGYCKNCPLQEAGAQAPHSEDSQ